MWIEISGYEGLYKINESGEVINIVTGALKKVYFNPQGYKMITLCKSNRSRVFLLHRLIARYFVPNPKNYRCVNHIDGDKQNNDLFNLEWCNHSHNNKHAYDTGLKKPTTKPVIQYDEKMNFIKRFNSVSETAGKFCISLVSRSCRKQHLKHGGFYWRFE